MNIKQYCQQFGHNWNTYLSVSLPMVIFTISSLVCPLQTQVLQELQSLDERRMDHLGAWGLPKLWIWSKYIFCILFFLEFVNQLIDFKFGEAAGLPQGWTHERDNPFSVQVLSLYFYINFFKGTKTFKDSAKHEDNPNQENVSKNGIMFFPVNS